jgi:predicted nucleic acid-binding Zn ribbon protein
MVMQKEDKYGNNDDSTSHIGDLLQSTLSSMDLEEDYLSGKLMKNWEEIVGGVIARNVRFFKLKDKEIRLLTTSSAWRYELFAKREEIIGKCNEFLCTEAVETMKIR